MLAFFWKDRICPRRFGRTLAVLVSMFVVALMVFTNATVAADETPDVSVEIRELQARLAELRAEQERLTIKLDRQAEAEIAAVTEFWEQAIEDLRAEVEWEIKQVTTDYEYEATQIFLGGRRAGSLRSLKADLDAVIAEKWAWFDAESQMKRQYLQDDIAEIERAKIFELNYLLALIDGVETELEALFLEESELPADDVGDTVIVEDPEPEPTEREVEPEPVFEDQTDEVLTDSGSEDRGRNRGFFTNSISVDPNGLNNALDPTTLAVLGILITLAATGIQLVKGN